MRIIVLVKEVPDTYGARTLNLETGLAERGASEPVLDEIGERSVELALTLAAEVDDAEVAVMSMSPESAVTRIRKSLAMGADRAVHIADEGLRGADLTLTAEVLAAAIRREAFDLVVAGDQSTDGVGGVIPAMLAEHLGAPHLTSLDEVALTADEVSGTRTTDGGSLALSAPLPAVISITEALPDARFPNVKGIMAAKKKPFDTWTLADLDIAADDLSAPRSIMTAVAERPPRVAGVKIVDDGDGGTKLAEYLTSNKLVRGAGR
ncbi:electron transfer flavoprotein subunit beta/FixA family protein [Microbacterium sp. G2-8]|uniref:electron transfer flavoprotein subunit beta/FixA family protein n=1 Tax=Microbacterium sp. G2-8 TaxID=2842454 RepID=UPI001C89C628|nr:electron transfer flavoprotein subunit beta/FixA family protein [Microbacterium sp. G2-8]